MKIERAMAENPDFWILSADQRAALADAFVERRVRKGVELIEEGKADDDPYLIVSGEVEVSRRPQSASQVSVFGTLGPGAFLGLLSRVAPGPRAATVTALTDLVVAVLPASAFTLLYSTSSSFSVRFRYVAARQLARDLHRTGEAIRAGAPASA